MLAAPSVSPLQGGECFLGTVTRGFTPGYNMMGLQPKVDVPLTRQINVSSMQLSLADDLSVLGLKARHVIAQAEGLGKLSHKSQAL